MRNMINVYFSQSLPLASGIGAWSGAQATALAFCLNRSTSGGVAILSVLLRIIPVAVSVLWFHRPGLK